MASKTSIPQGPFVFAPRWGSEAWRLWTLVAAAQADELRGTLEALLDELSHAEDPARHRVAFSASLLSDILRAGGTAWVQDSRLLVQWPDWDGSDRGAIQEKRRPDVRPPVLVIDEFADIMLAGKKSADEFESLVQRVSQVGRSRLMHLVLATQRPDKETIRGAVKANLNARAVFRLPTQADSLTVLGQGGAERLMLHGDMLFQHGTGVPARLQGYKF